MRGVMVGGRLNQLLQICYPFRHTNTHRDTHLDIFKKTNKHMQHSTTLKHLSKMHKHAEIKRWHGSKVIRLGGILSEKWEPGNSSCVWSPVRHYHSCVANLAETNRFVSVNQIGIGSPLKKQKSESISTTAQHWLWQWGHLHCEYRLA